MADPRRFPVIRKNNFDYWVIFNETWYLTFDGDNLIECGNTPNKWLDTDWWSDLDYEVIKDD